AAVNISAKAILADSMSGRTIRSLAAYRGNRMIWAKCYDKRVVRELALSYGVIAQFMETTENSHEFVVKAVNSLIEEGKIEKETLLVVIAGNFGHNTGASYIEIGTVENLLGK
ncbi:MAG: pyruvate kinase alpha/beta domain-containing protein, partial [Bacteroidales bacterium]